MSTENKLFVGGVVGDWSEDSLRDEFEQYGKIIDVFVKKDRDTGRASGFGFVTFEDSGSAEDAIKGLDGKEFDGTVLKVERARQRPSGGGYRGGSRGGYRGGGGGGYGGGYGGGNRGYGGGGDGGGGGYDGGYRDRGDRDGGSRGYRSRPYNSRNNGYGDYGGNQRTY